MVEGGGRDRSDVAIGLLQAQAVAGLDPADAGGLQAAGLGRRQHLLVVFRCRGPEQFVVIAAGQRIGQGECRILLAQRGTGGLQQRRGLQQRGTAGGIEDMAEIARQAIAEVAAGAGQSAQGQTQRHAWLRLFQARARGLQAIIAGAGGAAHLPGMVAAKTPVPVLGVPVQSKALSGQDSLLSIVQMPKGIPVATFAIGEAGAANAGLFAVALLAVEDAALAQKLADFRARQTQAVLDMSLD